MKKIILPLLLAILSCSVYSGSNTWGTDPAFVVVPPDIAHQINVAYLMSNNEFAICVEYTTQKFTTVFDVKKDIGWDDEQAYVVTKISVSDMTDATPTTLGKVVCPPNTAVIHTHPSGRFPETAENTFNYCFRSYTDRNTFWEKSQEFEVIWCGDNIYKFYTRNGGHGIMYQNELMLVPLVIK
jgi:hypothetical protein